jgi:hypothetical protein
MDLLELFCDVDDFWQAFSPQWHKRLLKAGLPQRTRSPQLCESEIMTLVIHFHHSCYRNFKSYYCEYVSTVLTSEFPRLVSYNRFVELMPRVLVPLWFYLHSRKGQVTGISFIDSTPIAVCHNRRISSHKVFAGIAQRGKTSMGWFYGFKLHLLINEHGEILAFSITAGNVDDRKPVAQMTEKVWGKVFGDKGYISAKLLMELFAEGVELITRIRRNMKQKLMPMLDKILLRKRALIEVVNDQLKNISQIEHTRHRSVANFLVNVVSGLIAYSHQDKKPSLNLTADDKALVPAVL